MNELKNKFFLLKNQISLLKESRKIRNNYRHIKLERFVYDYLFKFFKQEQKEILILGFLLFSQGLLEAILIIFSRNQISHLQEKWLIPYFWPFFVFLILLFFINSYLSIRKEKTLEVVFTNSVRRRIFDNYLNQSLVKMKRNNKSKLIAKISYQVPLVSMGMSNTFFGLFRWAVDIAIVALLSFWGGLNWLLILSVVVILSIIIGLAAYFISQTYIAQEVTFYSQILKEVDDTTSEKYFLKIFNREKHILKRFDRLVDFDSFFRIRRNLWLKLSAKIVFAILIFLSVLSNFFSTNFFSWFNSTGSGTKFLFLFLLIYLSRALYEILRVGLYSFPAHLGLFLTISKPNKITRRDLTFNFKDTINFYGRKIKLYKNAEYWRHFNLIFKKGERYLFYSSLSKGKTSLAKLLAGLETFNPRTVRIKIDNKRLDYNSWQKFGSGICFFDPNFSSEKNIMEFITGQDKDDIDFLEIEKTLNILKAYPLVSNLIASDCNYNKPVDRQLARNSSALALYVAICLLKKPELIIIDNVWLDFDYQENKDLLSLLDKELPQSTIIAFSRQDNNIFNYHKKHKL